MDRHQLKEVTKADLYRYCGSFSFRFFCQSLLFCQGFKFTYLLRRCAYYKNKGLRVKFLFFRLLLQHFKYKYGFDISYKTDIGAGFYIGHWGGVVINSKVRIGKNVNIAPGVIIGRTNRGEKKGIPIVGNNVWIGAHSVIVGNITIGDEALIGPNAYVNFDVPEKAIVIGNPGEIVSFNGSGGYVNNKVL